MSDTDKKMENQESESVEVKDLESPEEQKRIVAMEEEKLMAKYPQTAVRAQSGQSAFLLRRMAAKGPKFFDSGDYQMAKQKVKPNLSKITAQPTGEAIPTPDTVPPRKISILDSKCAAGVSSTSS